MTSPGIEPFFEFDPEAVAAQIRAQAPAAPLPAQATAERPSGEATANDLLPDTLTDRGNAKPSVKLYANDYRHVPNIGWYRWDTTRWQIDEDETVLWAAGDLAETIAAHDPRGLFTTTALHKHRTRAMSTSGMNAMLAQARSAPGMVLRADRLDADPYALCTPQGVVDLRTGLLRDPDPNKDFHSRSTTVGPQQTHPALAALPDRHLRRRRRKPANDRLPATAALILDHRRRRSPDPPLPLGERERTASPSSWTS